MTIQEWKAKKVSVFMQEIKNVPREIAEEWVAQHGYNATIAIDNWKALNT